MAEQRITTKFLFKSKTVGSGSAGGTAYSDAVDLRDISKQGDFGLTWTVATAGGAATCASCNFYVAVSPTFSGTYTIAENGTCGTVGNAGGTLTRSITVPPVPFIKIGVIAGTSGTALVTAALHVR